MKTENKRGPGQPPKPKELKRVNQTFSMSPATLAKIKAWSAKQRCSLGATIDMLAESLPKPPRQKIQKEL